MRSLDEKTLAQGSIILVSVVVGLHGRFAEMRLPYYIAVDGDTEGTLRYRERGSRWKSADVTHPRAPHPAGAASRGVAHGVWLSRYLAVWKMY